MADAGPAGLGDVNLSSGAYTMTIPIEVPPFHGLEPKLALTYSSQGGNGFVGVGWGLSGFSTVERKWRVGYLLDGQELYACQPGSVSPSCTTGGTHSTKIESFLKIKFDSAANTWTVWGKDGTKTTFSPIMSSAIYTVRWGQTSAVDTDGNTVTYGWACVDGDCYPSMVSYNGYSATLFRETRPDVLSFGKGYDLVRTQYRLRSIIVQLGTSPIRGYALTYTTSSVTGRSLLASVQPYGTDLAHSSGNITAGTSLPAQTFTYQNDALGQTFVAADEEPPTPAPVTENVTWTNLSMARVIATGAGNNLQKGVGYADAWDAGASSTRAIQSGDGYVEFTNTSGLQMVGLNKGDASVGFEDIDFAIRDGSGAMSIYESGSKVAGDWAVSSGDVLRVEVVGGVVKYRRNGILLYTSTATPDYPLLADASIKTPGSSVSNVTISGILNYVAGWCGNGGQLRTGDFDGDGRTDQLCFTSGGHMPVHYPRVRTATATGFAAPSVWMSNYVDKLIPGDFNGDGKTDLGDYKNDYFHVALSTGTGFSAPVSWGHTGTMYGEDGLAHACYGSAHVGSGDFNGDGNADVWCRSVSDSRWFVGLSNGASGFSFSIWIDPVSVPGCQGSVASPVDFNADGMSDFYCIESNSVLRTYVSIGNDFVGGPYMPTPFCSIESYIFSDLNGDGKTDMACKSNGDIALSNGYSFAEQGSSGGWCYSGPVIAGDFDGDGTSELACNSNSSNVEVRKWQGSGLSAAEVWKTGWCGSSTTAGDFNGDGKTDLLCPSYAFPVAFAGTPDLSADLMSSAANGVGGAAQLAYTTSTTFPNTNNPGPSYAVTAQTITDGRGGSSLTTYIYEGKKVYRPERMQLGFSKATTTLPCLSSESSCPSVETRFNQDPTSAGQPSLVIRRDQAGNGLSETVYEYSPHTPTLPRQSLLLGEWNYTLDGSGPDPCPSFPCAAGRGTHRTHQYDAYGNVIRTDFSGDDASSGDETMTTWTYQPNTSAYIVDRVAEQKVFGPGEALASSRAFWYDGQTGLAPPIKGHVTTALDWLNTESRWIATTMTYDAYGNLIRTTDPTDRWVETTYDTTHHVYPISVTRGMSTTPSNEVESTTWDFVCGIPAQRVDVAAQTFTMQHDQLCRPTRTDGPLGAFEIRSYLDAGNPLAQRVVVEVPSASPDDGTGNDYAMQYLDGLGRTYRTVKKGPSTNQSIVVETAYDARGQVRSRTAPYYANDTAYTTTFTYDPLGRPTRTTHPDGNYVEQTYDFWRQTARDEHGHLTATVFDAYGRPIVREQYSNGQTLQTVSSYDALGRLIGMTDPAENVWSWTYDWLGRNIARGDPDSGTWTFAYDDAGRVIQQTDAKTQATTFTYDLAGRLATKANADGTVTITRSEPRAGYVNAGQVTSVTSPGTVLRTDYDALGRAVRQVRTLDGLDYAAERRYDAGGRLLGITYPDGDAVGTPSAPLMYDSAGRLLGIPGVVSSIAYDAAGRPVTQTNVNGTVTSRGFSAERGFLTSITTSGLNTIQDLAYTPDEAGMVTHVTSPFPNEGWTYTHDELHRLTDAGSSSDPAQSQSFGYDDETGNILSNSRIGTYTYPPPGSSRPHAPSAVAGEAMTYDPNGNLLSGRGRSIAWTADNFPRQVNATEYAYDGLGARVKKLAPGATSLYPFGDDYEVTNGVITKYVVVDGLGVVAKRVGVETFWLHTDRLGSIQAITDAAGTEVQRRTFRPYGDKIAETTGHPESRGYIGERQDPDTGLTYLHARYYDPALGVFLNPDPIGPNGGLNGYGYSFGDPVNLSDPSGLVPPICLSRAEDGTCEFWYSPPPPRERDIIEDPTRPPGRGPKEPGPDKPETPPPQCQPNDPTCLSSPPPAQLAPKPRPAPPPPPPSEVPTIFEQANAAQNTHFGPGWDPYKGGYRHCFAGCTLGRMPFPWGRLYMWGWDLTREFPWSPHSDRSSPNDMGAERNGWGLADRAGECGMLCLGPYPPYPRPGSGGTP